VELTAVWLHFMRGGEELPMVPVLCGPFSPLPGESRHPEDIPHVSALLEVLGDVVREHRTLVIAAGDLAHIGPAFGDSMPADGMTRARLRASDEERMRIICEGDAQSFLEGVKRQHHHRVCGLSPIYLALRLLRSERGTVAGYAQCPADARGASLVSVCGILLH
jgi:AmmeMemoRadiSam system protein B